MVDVAINFAEPTGEISPGANPLTGQKTKSFFQIPDRVPDPREWLSQQRQLVRPWLLFLQTSNFKAPPQSVPRLSNRIMRNIEYFQANYVFVFLGLVVYCLVTSSLTLILAIAATFYVGYRLNKRHPERKLILFGKELTIAEQYGILAMCSFPVYYLLGAHAFIFWAIGASMVVITTHAAFYNIDAVGGREDFDPLLEV